MKNFIKKSSLVLLLSCSISPSFAHGHHGQPQESKVGNPGNPAKATQVIEVTASDDMRFHFSKALKIKDGEIVTFKITNQGNIAHEFSIGDEKEQEAHRKMMQKMPNMVHEDENTVTIKPHQTQSITWQFKAGEEVVISCNIPGHYEAGMVQRLKVKAG